MRNFFSILILLTILCGEVCAQDTSAYEIQRKKINALLANRSAKFGQYDQSLNTRTGIFGLQTKRDIRNSNEILREIALTDNDIFQELKVLLDYKDVQMQEAKTYNETNSERILNYRRTIKNLQDKNQQLADQLGKESRSGTIVYLLMSIFLIGCIFLGFFLRQKIKLIRQNEKAAI